MARRHHNNGILAELEAAQDRIVKLENQISCYQVSLQMKQNKIDTLMEIFDELHVKVIEASETAPKCPIP